MAENGQPKHFDRAPDYMLIDDQLHQIDKVGGQIVSHHVYSPEATAQLAERANKVAAAATLIGRIAGMVRRKRSKKEKKREKRGG